MIVQNNDPKIVEKFRAFGVNTDLTAKQASRFWGALEPPVRISETRIFHDFSMGAFSYVSGGFLYHTHIGRYSSLANGLHIGQGNHPLDWLSTHPFQYQSGIFDVRESYEFSKEYISDRSDHRCRSSIGKPSRTIIGSDCWISTGVYIRNGVSVGDGAVIGARSVVTKDIPAYAIAVGVPARVIRYRFPKSIISQLLELQWWRHAPWQLRDLDFPNVHKCIEILMSLREQGLQDYNPKSLTLKRSND
jgi:acetyltransferase-like isoleucine patch superfamily enzyme